MNIKPLITLFLIYFPLLSYADNTAKNNLKLYTLDCGTIDVADMKDLSDNGKYDGEKIQLVNPCFLIHHPKGYLLWDTGHNDNLADNPDGEVSGVWHAKMSTKLTKQLELLGISATDINYLSLSHIHPDHSGNANAFATSTFIVNELEHTYMFSEPANSYFGEYYQALKSAKTIFFNNDHDVFNDGSVVIKSMPGHTPDSSVLLIRLPNAGNVLLSGDLYIHEKERQIGSMLKYNVDKSLTVKSRKNFEDLVKKENANVIIQHEKHDFDRLPKFPKFLD